MEHRWGQRMAVSIPVRLMCYSYGSVEGRITDISLSGARIHTDLELPPLAPVTVVIEPSDVAGSGWCHEPDTRLAARVVRRELHELGIEWNPTVHSEAIALLRAAVGHRAPSQAVRA